MSAAAWNSLLRSVSVSSIRSTNRPPWCRANSQLNSAVRALPRCSSPVGLGAKRVVMGPWDTGGFYGIESPPMKKLTVLPALLGLLLSVQSQAANTERVRVTTNLGEFVIEMQRDRAPLTVENFLGYVRADGYRNTLFHRAVANFVIQGGGVNTEYKPVPTQKQIPNEAGNGLKNLRGTVGLARASGPHSGDRQIYINVADNADLDPLPTRWGYAVFGRVVEGMEVVDRVSVSPTGAMGPFKQEAPMQAVIIQKIELLTDGLTPSAKPVPAAVPTETPPASGAAPATPPAKPAGEPASESPPQK
jgi:cyclophilin family peptidyl-prolyl cis-trans isomerase